MFFIVIDHVFMVECLMILDEHLMFILFNKKNTTMNPDNMTDFSLEMVVAVVMV